MLGQGLNHPTPEGLTWCFSWQPNQRWHCQLLKSRNTWPADARCKLDAWLERKKHFMRTARSNNKAFSDASHAAYSTGLAEFLRSRALRSSDGSSGRRVRPFTEASPNCSMTWRSWWHLRRIPWVSLEPGLNRWLPMLAISRHPATAWLSGVEMPLNNWAFSWRTSVGIYHRNRWTAVAFAIRVTLMLQRELEACLDKRARQTCPPLDTACFFVPHWHRRHCNRFSWKWTLAYTGDLLQLLARWTQIHTNPVAPHSWRWTFLKILCDATASLLHRLLMTFARKLVSTTGSCSMTLCLLCAHVNMYGLSWQIMLLP